jgi:hypothetical protein
MVMERSAMLDFTRPTAYADLSANLTRIYANAALRTFVAAASQSLMLWSGFINASLPPLLRPVDENFAIDWLQLALPHMFQAGRTHGESSPPDSLADEKRIVASQKSFSAYRSDGGHAVAQIIMG